MQFSMQSNMCMYPQALEIAGTCRAKAEHRTRRTSVAGPFTDDPVDLDEMLPQLFERETKRK
jgi:hypothetical protein